MAVHHAAKALIALALSALFIAPSIARAEGDAERGRKLAYTCLGCHGIDNYRNSYPNYPVPKLGGQSAIYIQSALNDYASKARWHPTMQGQSEGLSEQDRADLGAYFEKQKAQHAAAKAAGTPPDQAQTCAACHGLDGKGILPEYPTIGGQYAGYLEQALNDYRQGKRKNAVMNGFAGQLSSADIRALAAWYAKQAGVVTAK